MTQDVTDAQVGVATAGDLINFYQLKNVLKLLMDTRTYVQECSWKNYT